ncbi:MAG: ATP-binding cassette domain-containing protein [Bacteroidota bacterium]
MMELQVQKRLNSPGGQMLLDVQLKLDQGQIIGLYGKSGAGKTSLLRIIAGLFDPDQAKIAFANQVWEDTQRKIRLRPQERKVGLVFQDYALFPNMTVRQNLEFARQKGQDAQMVDELIQLSELGQLQDQYPTTLSGGQQQRVALARSLVQRPQLLLLDEPLSAVDQEMRQKLRRHLRQLHDRFALTTILISHEWEEIAQLADQVVILDAGKVVQIGSPAEVFEEPHKRLSFRATVKATTPEADGGWVNLLTATGKTIQLWLETKQMKDLVIGQEVRVRELEDGWAIA